ncbi:MAG: hypothetical protein LBH32_08510 [Dysgonamonadaceae bacterium]|jgi:hypothetical protein|nr:hypothetical protein [Dysgonamonadaceae bacterium]
MQKSGYIFNPKVRQANSKVNRANAQSRHSGILFARANGKLCFAQLTSFCAAQNNLPFDKGGMRSEVVHPKEIICYGKSPRAFTKKQASVFKS